MLSQDTTIITWSHTGGVEWKHCEETTTKNGTGRGKIKKFHHQHQSHELHLQEHTRQSDDTGIKSSRDL